jgi:hypothetical protein
MHDLHMWDEDTSKYDMDARFIRKCGRRRDISWGCIQPDGFSRVNWDRNMHALCSIAILEPSDRLKIIAKLHDTRTSNVGRKWNQKPKSKIVEAPNRGVA